MKPHEETKKRLVRQWLDKAEQDIEAAALTPYGVEVRCPGDAPEPDREETLESLKLARKVRDVVLGELKGFA